VSGRRVAALGGACAAALQSACATAPPWRGLSPDHRTTVEVATRGRLSCVTVGRGATVCHDGVAVRAIAFSRHGGHVAYPAQDGARWTIVRDGIPGALWDGVGAPVLSADGARLAFPALSAGAWRVVVDGRVGEPFDEIIARSIAFSPGGESMAYAARRGDSTQVVINGVASAWWDGIGVVTFSKTGAHYAYAARRAARVTLVVDGAVQPPHDAISEVAMSADGDRWAFAARDGDEWRVIERSASHGPYAAVRALAFRPGTGDLTFIARVDDRERVVMGGVAQAEFRSVDAPAFDADGGTWGYVARDSGVAQVLKDGIVIARESWAADLAIAPHGLRFAYVARRHDTLAVVDSHGTRYAFDVVVEGTLQFVGESWACLAGDRARKKLYVVVDGIGLARRLDWEEVVRLMSAGEERDVLRAWVGAEVELWQARPGR